MRYLAILVLFATLTSCSLLRPGPNGEASPVSQAMQAGRETIAKKTAAGAPLWDTLLTAGLTALGAGGVAYRQHQKQRQKLKMAEEERDAFAQIPPELFAEALKTKEAVEEAVKKAKNGKPQGG